MELNKLDLYHCLVCDGCCIFDLFFQIQCNIHHAPKRCITKLGWCNIHHKLENKLESHHCLVGDGYLTYFFKVYAISGKYITNFDWDNTHHKPEINWNYNSICFVKYVVTSKTKY